MSSVPPSSYYQALRSCLEPAKLVERRVLRLRLAPPNPSISPSPSSIGSDHQEPAAEPSNNAGGFSFLQCMTVKETGEINRDQVFTLAPSCNNNNGVIKCSASSLSKQSLEMCTESLGSETGSDDRSSEDDELLLPLSTAVAAADGWSNVDQEDETKTSVGISSSRAARQQRVRNMRRSSGRRLMLPPPLSSIGGSTGVQMRSRREEGRLVVTAVAVSSSRTKFHAERANGRLRLHLTTDFPTQELQKEEEKTEEDIVETKEGEDDDEEWGEMEEAERASRGMNRGSSGRCKEAGDGNRGLMNWEPFWVAT